MLSSKMQEALNKQINAEIYSAYLYWSMSAYFESINLPGHVTWMYAQAQEEFYHARRIYNFIAERTGRVRLAAIEEPAFEWKSPEAVFAAALEHERLVTSLINDLVTLAREEKDYATDTFLQWFVNEQVEEESTADKILQKQKLVSGDGAGLFVLDQELAVRPFVLMLTEQALAAGGAA